MYMRGGLGYLHCRDETQRLLPSVTNLVHHEHFPGWSRWDHIWSLDALQRVYRQMIALMEKSPWMVHVAPWDGGATHSHTLGLTGFCTRTVILLSSP